MRASLPRLKSYQADFQQKGGPKIRPLEVLLETWLLGLLVIGLIWPVGLFVLQLVSQRFTGGPLHWFGFITAGVCAGGLINTALWPIMRPVVRGFGPWLFFASVGWALGFGISTAALGQGDLNVVSLLAVFFGGSVYGLAQWLAIKPDLPGSEAWILLTGLSWPLATGLGVLLQGSQAGAGPASFNLAALSVIGWPTLSILAFFLFITLFSRPLKVKALKGVRLGD